MCMTFMSSSPGLVGEVQRTQCHGKEAPVPREQAERASWRKGHLTEPQGCRGVSEAKEEPRVWAASRGQEAKVPEGAQYPRA